MASNFQKILIASLLILTGCSNTDAATFTPQRPQVHSFIEQMVHQHGFNREEITETLKQAVPQPKLIALIKKPQESKPWYIYRKTFLNRDRVEGGVNFWQQHAKTLAQAERQYGIPASVIVAILGVETNYGQIKGEHRVLDSLSTLAFNYPPRAHFFQSELKDFFLMSRENSFKATQLLGSYAGAFGLPQFMPSSYRSYAVAAYNHAHPDIINNADDAILSVANYFKKHGWKTGQAIAVPASANAKLPALNYQDLKPKYSVAQVQHLGLKPSAKIHQSQMVAVLKLAMEDSSQYWLGLQNFYVISRYNPRLNYTMAVFQLSEEIAYAMHHGNPEKPS